MHNPLLLLKAWSATPFQYRTLLLGFLRQDIKGRFAASMGGLVWSLLTPLANILIYIFVFSLVLKVRIPEAQAGTDEFHIYLLAGLLPWMAFADTLTRGTAILLEKAGLITKVSFPVQMLPYVSGFSAYLLNGVGLLLLLGYLLVRGYGSLTWLWLPLIFFFNLLLAIGLVAITAALCVFIRDLQQLIGLLVSVWFFLTPIIYPEFLVPEEFRAWIMLNPMYYFITLYREVLLQHSLSFTYLAGTAAFSAIVFAAGGWFFMRIKHAFGDVL